MHINVTRFTSDHDSTVSVIRVDGWFVCFGLEDEYREEKVAAETRIPAGRYEVGVRTVGGFHSRYSNRFSEFHKGMLEVQGVPNFKYVLIHCGNTHLNTAGCLLVGAGCYAADGNMSIQASVHAYKAFYQRVIDEAIAGDLVIEFIDSDR